MRVCFILFLLLIFAADNNENPAGFNKLQKAENFDWILGNWVRTNDKNEMVTTETWKKISDTIYEGTGLSMKNGEIVFRENLRVLKKKKKKNWVYEVTGVNADTTNFILTSISKNSFTAENPDNPFPKEIIYRLEEQKLIAEISDDEKKILFESKKKDQK